MVRGKVSKCKNINLNGMDIFSRKNGKGGMKFRYHEKTY